ncbi:hypothetical protein WA588_003006 [Blastocystis sp. NMH]
MLLVNVTTDASVWCGAWPEGESINLQFVQMSLPGTSVHDSKYILLTGLQPSTLYDVTCLGLAQNGYMREDPLQIKQRVRTGDVKFEIDTAVAKRSSVYVAVNCNLGIAVLCLLFNEKGVKVDSKVFDPLQDENVVFSAPSIRAQYHVQCSAFNQNKVLVSTELVPVTRMRRTRSFVWLILLVLILLLSVVALVAWKRFSTARSVYQMNDEEIVSLLQKSHHSASPPEGVYGSFVHTEDRSIRCSKCGFNNATSATVCRDCNSPLHNITYVTSLSRIVY